MPLWAAAAATACLTVAAPCPVDAQARIIHGVVVDSATQTPVNAVLVALVDDANRDLQRFLVDATGAFRFFIAGPGRFSLRAERLGMATRTVDSLVVAETDTIPVRIALSQQAIALEGIEARGSRRCELSADLGEATQRVWEEARKVLNAVSIADSAGAYVYNLEKHVRELDPGTLRIRRETRSGSRTITRRPFVSRPVELLLDDGWMLPDPEGDLYFAPDAHVLLSEEFLATHCLRLRARDESRQHLVGLEFHPIRSWSTRTGIEGVLWLSRDTGALRWLDYSYRNLPGVAGEVQSDQIGGRVEFHGLADGSWIVSKWHIRMPLLVAERDGIFGGRRARLGGLVEEGGRVVRARRSGTRQVAYSEVGGVIAGEVAGVAAGGSIGLVGIGVEAQVDSRGRFTIAGLPEGTYRLAYLRPSLGGLDRDYTTAETRVESGDTARVLLEVPDPHQVLARACGTDDWDPARGVLVGNVFEDGSRFAAGIPVVAEWVDRVDAALRLVRQRSERTATGPLGEFQLCRVPANHRTITVTAGTGTDRTSVEVILTPEEPVRAVSLVLRR